MAEALAVVESLQAASSLSSLNESTMTLGLTGSTSTSALPMNGKEKEKRVLPLKMALFNLQKYIKEADFAVEFMLKGGLSTLVKLVERDIGGMGANSLAVSDYSCGYSFHLDGLLAICTRRTRNRRRC
jgi:hypothetical protein